MALKPRHRRKHSPDTASFLDAGPVEHDTPSPPSPGAPRPPRPGEQVRWSCGKCPGYLRQHFWWQAPGGIIRCLRCEAPNLPTAIVARGTADDAPQVTAVYDRPGSIQPTTEEIASWTKPRKFRWIVAGFLDQQRPVQAYWSDASSHGRCLRCGAETREIAPDGFCLACQAADEEL